MFFVVCYFFNRCNVPCRMIHFHEVTIVDLVALRVRIEHNHGEHPEMNLVKTEHVNGITGIGRKEWIGRTESVTNRTSGRR